MTVLGLFAGAGYLAYKASAAPLPISGYLGNTFLAPLLLLCLALWRDWRQQIAALAIASLGIALFAVITALVRLAADQIGSSAAEIGLGIALNATALLAAQERISGAHPGHLTRLLAAAFFVALSSLVYKLESHPSVDPVTEAPHIVASALAFAVLSLLWHRLAGSTMKTRAQ